MLTPEVLGNRLRELRKSRNLTRKDLADALFVSQPTISRWESGDRQPDISTLTKIADVLETDIGILLAEPAETAVVNIIVVDDEKIILSGNVRELKNALPEANVSGFLTAKEALSYAKNNKVQVAFLDIELRSAKGLTLAKKLEEIYAGTNIIFVTSFMEYMEDAWKMYASGFILKPLTKERILEEMRNLRHPIKGLKI